MYCQLPVNVQPISQIRVVVQVLISSIPATTPLQEAAERAEQLFLCSPWEVHAEAMRLKSSDQDAASQASLQAANRWANLLNDAADERRMEAWLPAQAAAHEKLDVHGGSAREAALVEVGHASLVQYKVLSQGHSALVSQQRQ